MLFNLLPLALVPLAVSAVPVRRAIDATTLLVAQFAFTLETAETTFYQQALSKFQASDFITAGFSSSSIPLQQFSTFGLEESIHVTAIEEFITNFGATPLSGCSFDFSTVLTDVKTMVQAARLVENVGVGAYLGAAHLVQDQSFLTAAASILTIEARHQTILNLFRGALTAPQPFDIPLAPQEVLAIVGSFISGCSLGVTANPSLTITNTETVTVGTSLQFSSPALNGSTSGFACQMLAGGMPFSLPLPYGQCVVPPGINGPVAIYITADIQALNGDVVQRQSNAIVAGPTMVFIDVEADAIGSLITNVGSNLPPPSTTQTMSMMMGNSTAVMSSSATPPPSSSSSSNSTGSGVIVNGVSSIAASMVSVAPASTPSS